MNIPPVQAGLSPDLGPDLDSQQAGHSQAEATETRALHRAVRELNESGAYGAKNELVFVIDRATRRPLLRVVNRETREVIVQLPPEQVLRLADDLKLLAPGLEEI
ncbi:MAG: flagellar protein FlaG [Bryobacteraceae bacterium]